MTRVYFATNRKRDGTGTFGYGSQSVGGDPTQSTYAVADVSHIVLPDETSGHIDAISEQHSGDFTANVLDEIVNTQKHLLLFIHGFANSFEDAIKRAAFNREWLVEGGADMQVVAFTWPSAGDLIAAPPHMPPDAYLADQVQAGRSGIHLAYFLDSIARLKAGYRQANPTGRVVLLAHSMGNYALQAAIQAWFQGTPPQQQIFDEVLLPGADEVDDTFDRPSGGRLSDLPKISGRVTVYHSWRDVAMYLSGTINVDCRLGFNGPAQKHDTSRYPPAKFRIQDCAMATDYDPLNPPDATHQYYRRSKIVRSDIVAAILDKPGLSQGIGALSG
jgi:esterase/lipase superfamily enzyme